MRQMRSGIDLCGLSLVVAKSLDRPLEESINGVFDWKFRRLNLNYNMKQVNVLMNVGWLGKTVREQSAYYVQWSDSPTQTIM
mgnify:CR=1 FL=1